MEDKILVKTEYYKIDKPIKLECQKELEDIQVAYETYGKLNEQGDNAILILHALTADAHAAHYHSKDDKKPGWWDTMIGDGKAFDTRRFFVICSNVLGGCKGTTGPSSINPKTGREYAENLFLTACNNSENGYFGQSFPLLDKNVAVALDRLIVNRENSCEIDGVTYYGRDIFIELYNAFSSVLESARAEFTQSYRPFAELNEAFSSLRERLVKIKTGELCIAYFVAAFICFMIVPAIFRGNSVALLLLRGRCIGHSGLKMRWYNYVLRWMCRSLFYFSNIMFVLLLTYGRYASFFLTCSIVGGLKFYMLCLIPVIVMLISFVIFAFDKSERRTLTDRLSLTVVKEKE